MHYCLKIQFFLVHLCVILRYIKVIITMLTYLDNRCRFVYLTLITIEDSKHQCYQILKVKPRYQNGIF